WECNVSNDQIRFASGDFVQRFLRAPRSPATEESRLGIDERAHGVAHHRVVIDEENTFASRLLGKRLVRSFWPGLAARFGFGSHDSFGSENTARTPCPRDE